MLLLGVDPGTQGALCLLDSVTGISKFHDTPNTKDIWQSTHDIEDWLRVRPPFHIAIEDVHSMGGMSAKSNFQFGRNLGLVEAVTNLSDSENDVEYVQPKVWQKACEITFIYPHFASPAQKAKIRKKATAARCKELYPKCEIYGPKGGLKDGRSDALMIAHYLLLKYGNTNENNIARA
jgi:hypothetical protein